MGERNSPGRPPKWLTALADVGDEVGVEVRDEVGDTEEASAQAQPDSYPRQQENAEDKTTMVLDSTSQVESESSRTKSRYTLRAQVHPPERLMSVSSRRASSREGVM